MDIYAFDKVTGEFLGARVAAVVPGRSHLPDGDPKKWLIPANTTTQAPPSADDGNAVARVGDAWALVEDHRGETVYAKATGAERKIKADEFGPIPDDVTTEKPGPHDKWVDGAWVEDADAALEASHAKISVERDRRIALGHTVALSTGKTFPVQTRNETDFRNINGLSSAGIVRQMGGDTATTTTFRDADNIDHDLTPPELIEMGLKIAAAVDALYKAGWAIKAMDPIPDDITNDRLWPVQGA